MNKPISFPKVPIFPNLLTSALVVLYNASRYTKVIGDRGNVMSRRLALIVGINQYQDTTFQPLQFAEQDARALAQWLVNEKGGKWSPADVQFVQGEYATHNLIESLIIELCLTQATSDDSVLIYFAGQAFLDERSGIGGLAFTDTSYRQAETALQLAPLAQKIMIHSRAGRILFFIDAFQTGPLWAMRRNSSTDMQPLLGTPMIQGLSQLNNRVVLCSCRGNEQAPEIGERGLGQLMYRTIIGLSGQAQDPALESVTLQSLYNYLSNKLNPQLHPQVFGQAQEPFVLVGLDTPSDNILFHANSIPTTPSAPVASPFYQASTNLPFSSLDEMRQSQSYASTATAQLSPSTSPTARNTSGHLSSLAAEQQYQQLLEQAKQALQFQRPIEALQIINQLQQKSPNDTVALTLKTQTLGIIGQYQEALMTVDRLIQLDSTNPLAWSMRAVILTNSGQIQEALKSIERSLELDPANHETYTIKTNIMGNLAIQQSQNKGSEQNTLIKSEQQRSTPRSFFIAFGLQLAGMLIGIMGSVLPVLRPTLPMALAFLLEGFGLSLLCVNAVRGTYRHGFAYLIPTLLTSLLMAGILGVSFGYKTVYRKIIFELQAHTTFLLPILFLAGWLAVASLLPFVLALIGLVARLISSRAKS